MWKKIFLFLGLIAVLTVISVAWVWRPISATHPAIAEGNLPDLIPLRDFYANQDSKWGYSLSFDGKKMAWLEVEWFKTVLKVQDLETNDVSTLKLPKHSGGWRYYWAPDGHSMMLVIDRTGWENYEIAINDLSESNDKWKFFDFGEKTSSFIEHTPKTISNEIIVSHNGKDKSKFESYRLNLISGETKPIKTGAEGVSHSFPSFDYDGKVIGRVVYPEKEKSNWIFESGNPQDGWKEVARGDYTDNLNLVGKLQPDNTMYGISNLGLDKAALVNFDLSTGKQEIIYQNDAVDISTVNLQPHENKLQMAVTYEHIAERKFFDPQFEKDFRRLAVSDNANVTVKWNTSDFSKVIFDVHDIKTGIKSVLLDRKSGKLETLTDYNLNSHRDKLSPAQSIRVSAQDELEIPAYLYQPKGVNGPAPTVIIVHGGPIWRTSAYFDHNFIALLNNRGYAVLDINYRGSAGYGRAFEEAAQGEIAGKMSSDIIDVRNWAVEQGISDPDAVGIFGVSWGGFEVMTALTQNSDLFAAGININGVADLSTMLEEVPDYWRGWNEWLVDFAGDPQTAEGLNQLKQRSPLYNAQGMKTPLLMVQAGNDVRVVQSQSDRMAAELNKYNAPFEYQLVQGVGHSPFRWPWQKKYLLYRDIERFLAKHLGGLAGGHDYAILGAHILPE